MTSAAVKQRTPHRANQRHQFLKAALDYAKRGWFVLPLREGEKEPLTQHGYKDATADEAVIRRWWKEWPGANVGIALGASYGLVVVDVDGPSGRDELERLEREYGPMPPTREATSGRPHRRHLYYRYPENSIHRRIAVNGTKLDILVDGYVVAPPSIHPQTGKPYRWVRRITPVTLPDTIRRLAAGPSAARPTVAGGEVIPEGRRDDTLTSYAGTMRRRGFSESAILAALTVENAERCVPPLEVKDLQRIAHSIGAKAPLPPAFDTPLNDSTLAERFAAIEGDSLRWCPQWKKWLAWDGRHWASDVTLEAQRRVEAMIRGLFALLEGITDKGDRRKVFTDLNKYANDRRLNDVLSRARTRLVVTPDKLDTDPWVLNVDNGTLDLRTGTLRPHDPGDLITKRAPVLFDPAATAPRWAKFVADITADDADLAVFLQRAVGYTLVGVIREHAVFFCYGGGANGKTTFLETLQALLGDYAVTIDFETLLHQRYQSSEARRDLPRLDKARLVSANETPTNARWDERTIKQLTGGDTLGGRWLYQEKFEFSPTHTLWCRANDQPDVRDLSEAFWRRMRLIPFRRKFKGTRQVKDLKEQLLAERSGILNWALAGCLAWQHAGALPAVTRVENATAAYRREQDVYGLFIEARCALAPTMWTETHDLYSSFTDWWAHDHSGPRTFVPSVKAFGRGLKGQPSLVAESHKRRGRKVRGWRGIALR